MRAGEIVCEYGGGTYLAMVGPWSLYSRGRAICPDGRARNLKRIAPTADTWFSVPAAVTYRGRTVTGYVSVETEGGYSTETPDDPAIVRFRPYLYGANGGLFDQTDPTEEVS